MAISVGGIILCGGKSSRMGRPKHALPMGDETMLQRVSRLLAEVTSPIVVVAAPDQEVDCGYEVVRDHAEYRGPLAGIARGLASLEDRCDAAYVCACDSPLLERAFVREMISRLDQHEIAVPKEKRWYHPLAGVYRTSLANRAQALVDADRLRPLFLIEDSETLAVPVDELRDVDPELGTLRNINSPEDYEAIRAFAS